MFCPTKLFLKAFIQFDTKKGFAQINIIEIIKRNSNFSIKFIKKYLFNKITYYEKQLKRESF